MHGVCHKDSGSDGRRFCGLAAVMVLGVAGGGFWGFAWRRIQLWATGARRGRGGDTRLACGCGPPLAGAHARLPQVRRSVLDTREE